MEALNATVNVKMRVFFLPRAMCCGGSVCAWQRRSAAAAAAYAASNAAGAAARVVASLGGAPRSRRRGSLSLPPPRPAPKLLRYSDTNDAADDATDAMERMEWAVSEYRAATVRVFGPAAACTTPSPPPPPRTHLTGWWTYMSRRHTARVVRLKPPSDWSYVVLHPGD